MPERRITLTVFLSIILVMVLLLFGCALLPDSFAPSPVLPSPPVVPRNYPAVVSSPVLWTQLQPAGTTPFPRKQHASAYDVANDRLIIFGGRGSDQYFNDTWVLDNASGITGTPAWTVLSTSGPTAPKGTQCWPPITRQKTF